MTYNYLARQASPRPTRSKSGYRGKILRHALGDLKTVYWWLNSSGFVSLYTCVLQTARQSRMRFKMIRMSNGNVVPYGLSRIKSLSGDWSINVIFALVLSKSLGPLK